ncbi:MAG: histidine kinase dimerization/phospho-acceptor domain-containing protein, partial [Erythrobacter sp.]
HEPGWRLRNPDLVIHLADHEPEVAAAALARVTLASEDWISLIPHLPVRARGFLRLRRDLPTEVEALLDRLGVHDRGLPSPARAPGQAPTYSEEASKQPLAAVPRVRSPGSPRKAATIPPHQPPAPSKREQEDIGRTEISALVERISKFRRERGESVPDLDRSPRLPLGEVLESFTRAVTSFGFATDTAGRITWATSEVASCVTGIRLFAGHSGGEVSAVDTNLARAFARRQPIAHGPMRLTGAPAIAGDWLVDAEPRFSEEGHFIGYLGRFRRPSDAAAVPAGPEAHEADRIRQLLHELGTPVTAVQGFAEVIQQQLFGPAPHEYRALAAAIAADAARILAGFEEFDRLARLETGVLRVERGEADLAALVRRTAAQLDQVLKAQQAGFTLSFGEAETILVSLDPDDAEALVWRLLASLAASAAPGEEIAIELNPLIGRGTAMARLVCTLPARLGDEDSLFAATTRAAGTINPGLFGTGFALRLVRAEARAAGGTLRRDGPAVALTLPLLTADPAVPSPRAA